MCLIIRWILFSMHPLLVGYGTRDSFQMISKSQIMHVVHGIFQLHGRVRLCIQDLEYELPLPAW